MVAPVLLTKTGPFLPQTLQIVQALERAFPGLYEGVSRASDQPSGDDPEDDLEDDVLRSDIVFLSDGWAVRVDYDAAQPTRCLGLSAASTTDPAEALEADLTEDGAIPQAMIDEVLEFLREQRQSL